MARRRYRCTWDDVPWMDCDWIGAPGWADDEDAPRKGRGAFAGFRGEMKTSGVEITANVEHDQERDIFELVYVPASETALTKCKVHLERRPQAKGGARVYFVAPCCGRSVRKLALLKGLCGCARCASIQQPSRRKGRTQRLIAKAEALAWRLGCETWFSQPKERPKGMHRSTFEDLAQRHAIAVRDAMAVIGPRLSRAQSRGLGSYMGALARAGM